MQAGTNLPVVHLSFSNSIFSQPKIPCVVQVRGLGGKAESVPAIRGTARVHGGVSRGYPKTSFGLSLDDAAPWLGMRRSSHWVLNAAFIDRSLMRHKLSYDLFRSMSSPGAPRFAAASRFVELELNGNYNGVYLLTERVNRALLNLHRFDSNAPGHACIYKAVDHAANFSQPGHAGYEQHEPDPRTMRYWKPLDEFDRFVSQASEAEFNDPNTGIGSRLDLDNAIDFHLLVLLTSNHDGITKNFILARDAVAPGAPPARFFFVPWDYDATFGRNWDGSRVDATAWLSNHLFERLHASPAFRKKFAARWRQLRAHAFSVAAIHGLIDENVRTLDGAAARNSDRWQSLNGPYPDRLSFEEDVAQMKEWVAARVSWLDAEIARRAE